MEDDEVVSIVYIWEQRAVILVLLDELAKPNFLMFCFRSAFCLDSIISCDSAIICAFLRLSFVRLYFYCLVL